MVGHFTVEKVESFKSLDKMLLPHFPAVFKFQIQVGCLGSLCRYYNFAAFAQTRADKAFFFPR